MCRSAAMGNPAVHGAKEHRRSDHFSSHGLRARCLAGRFAVLILCFVLPLLSGCGTTTLNKELALGRLDKARALLGQKNVDVNEAQLGTGTTPLMYAVSHGDVELVRALLRRGAKTGVRDSKGYTAADYAAHGPSVSLEKLMEWAAARRAGRPWGLLTMLDLLFEHGESASGTNDNNASLLHAALGKPNITVPETLSYLLEHGAPADTATRSKMRPPGRRDGEETPPGTTPLMLAARIPRFPFVKLLLEAGADPGRIDAEGRSALLYATELGDPARQQVITLLLDAGAQPLKAGSNARDVHATGRAYLFAAMHRISKNDRNTAIEHMREAAEMLDIAAARHKSEANIQAVRNIALNVLSFALATVSAQAQANQMAAASPIGKGFGTSYYSVVSIDQPLRAGATMSEVALAEAAETRRLLGCLSEAKDADGLRGCLPPTSTSVSPTVCQSASDCQRQPSCQTMQGCESNAAYVEPSEAEKPLVAPTISTGDPAKTDTMDTATSAEHPCRADRWRLCATVKDRGQIGKCLRAHENEISEACRARLRQRSP